MLISLRVVFFIITSELSVVVLDDDDELEPDEDEDDDPEELSLFFIQNMTKINLCIKHINIRILFFSRAYFFIKFYNP